MFKKRSVKNPKNINTLKYGSVGLQTLNQIRYELIYLRVLKKLFKQKHLRGKVNFYRYKFWIFLKVNYILSSKSTNARMGSGVGILTRIAIRLPKYFIFLESRGYSYQWVRKIFNKLRFKYSFYFKTIK